MYVCTCSSLQESMFCIFVVLYELLLTNFAVDILLIAKLTKEYRSELDIEPVT